MHSRPLINVFVSLLAGGVLCPQAFCVTSRELEDKIKEAKINKGNVAVSISEHDANVQEFGVNVNDDYKKDDFKIDAVLIAKEVMNSDPSIERVRVYFRDKSNPSLYCSVMVHISIVKTFAGGAMKQADLLKSFSIEGPFNSSTAASAVSAPQAAAKTVATASASSATATSTATGTTASSDKGDRYGQFTENMNRAEQMILALENKHVNVREFRSKYTEVETLIQNHDVSNAQDKLERLLNNLDSQVKTLSALKSTKPLSTIAKSASAPTASSTAANITTRLAAYLMENSKESSKTYYMCVAQCGGDMHAALRMKYGKFAPSSSFALMAERFYIAEAILALKNAGCDVSRYEANYAELNDAADRRNTPKAKAIVEGFFKAFHLTDGGCLNWWSITQKNRYGGVGLEEHEYHEHHHHHDDDEHGGDELRERLRMQR